MLKLVTTKKWACAALLAFSVYTPNASAQNQLPPAHTYYADANGGDSRRIKERWSEDANGQKNGIYIKNASDGTPLINYTYVNGIKNGPAFEIREDGFYSVSWRSTKKFSGSYVNGKKQGKWTVTTPLSDGGVGELDRIEVYVDDVLHIATLFAHGKITAQFTYSNGEKNGAARVYGNSLTEYASGKYTNGKLSGTWINAGNDASKLVYLKNGRLDFQDGTLTTIVNANGEVRSLKAEEAQRVAEQSQQEDDERRNAATRAREDQKAYKETEERGFFNMVLPRIGFEKSSYVINSEGTDALLKLANIVNNRNKSIDKVSKIFISTYVNFKHENASMEKENYILALNRAYALKSIIANYLTTSSVNIITNACAHDMSTDERSRTAEYVTIGLESTDLNCQSCSASLSNRYNLQANTIISNDAMKRRILLAIRNSFADNETRKLLQDMKDGYWADKDDNPSVLRLIPSEFWVEKLGYGLPTNYTQIEDIISFQGEVKSLFQEMNKKYRTDFAIQSVFTNDLLLRAKGGVRREKTATDGF